MVVDDDQDGSADGEVSVVHRRIDLRPEGAIERDLAKLIEYRCERFVSAVVGSDFSSDGLEDQLLGRNPASIGYRPHAALHIVG